jgi:hypothetical protein
MIVIEEIYNQFNISDVAPPHYLELENIAEMFIPHTKNKETDIIHLVPLEQNLSPSKLESLMQASENLRYPNQAATLLLSRNSQGPVRFHILSASTDNETEAACRLLNFFIDEMRN